MKRNIFILLTLALVLAACGSGETGSAPTTEPETTDTTAGPLEPPVEVRPLLTVLDEGGFVPVQYNLRRIPRYVLMSNGTLYGQGPVPMIFPGPALPSIQTVSLDETTMTAIADLIAEAGLPEVDDERNDAAAARVADLPDTVFVYTDEDGGAHRFSVYALGFEEIDFGDARVDSLEALAAALDEAMASGQPADPYQPTSIDVYAAAQPTGFDAEYANTLDWPLDIAFDEMDGDTVGFRCLHLEGEAATAVLDRMSDANEATTFLDESGTEHTVLVRPLLPGQTSNC